MKKTDNPLLSIVIICRNEESNIENCIKSVIKNTTSISREIILVDSASTDKTLEIAKKYPIKIFQLNQSKYLSPSAGRYVGTQKAKGKFILFLDADVILIRGWIKEAISSFSEKKLAGVRGRLCNVFPDEKLNMKHMERKKAGYDHILGGQASMYRKSALEESGTFNPYLRGEEERELFHRLKSKGWKLKTIDVPMAYHLNKSRTESEIDEKAGYFRGVGQIIRKYKLHKISKDLIHSHRKAFLEIFALYFWIALFISSLFFKNILFTLIAIAILFMPIIFLIIHKGVYKVYLYIRARFMTSISIIRGFFIGLHNPSSYLKHVVVETIKK